MFTSPLGFVHTRIDGRLRAVWDDGSVTLPVIRGGDEGEENNPSPPAEKVFTQDDVNRIVAERVARTKTEPPADYAELQDKAKQFDEIQAANATDLDKATKRGDDLATENETLKKQVAEHESADRERNAREQIKKAAKDLAIDAEVVADLLLAKDAVTIDDAGQVTDAETAVKQLLESTPALAKPTTGKPAFGAGAGRSAASATDKGSVASGRDRWEQRHARKS